MHKKCSGITGRLRPDPNFVCPRCLGSARAIDGRPFTQVDVDGAMLDVDASDIAFGGVLIQKGSDGRLRPVGYFSDSVKPSQKSWAPTTKEAFTLILAMRLGTFIWRGQSLC